MDTAYRILVTGSRYAVADQHRTTIEWALGAAREMQWQWEASGAPRQIQLIHGGAKGADSICADLAREWGWDVREFPADWTTYGRGAGPLRNKAMVDAGANVVAAFPMKGARNQGTKQCMNYAEMKGLTVHEFELQSLRT